MLKNKESEGCTSLPIASAMILYPRLAAFLDDEGMNAIFQPMPERLRNELAADLLLNEEQKPVLTDKKLLKGAIYDELDSDISVSDVSWSDDDIFLFMHGALTTNHKMKLKRQFRIRAQNKYDTMVAKRKLQSENISEENYNGKNHVRFFYFLEINMNHKKDLRYFKIMNAKKGKSITSNRST